MRDYDTIIDELLAALQTTKTKVGSWQKDVLVLLLEDVIALYEDLRLEEIKKYKDM